MNHLRNANYDPARLAARRQAIRAILFFLADATDAELGYFVGTLEWCEERRAERGRAA